MAGEISAFISYSHDDMDFVDRLEADLWVRGFKPWVDRRKLEGGQIWEQEIDAAISSCDIFLIVLSPAAVDSPHVRHEFAKADELGKKLIPVIYRNCTIPSVLAAVDRRQKLYFTEPTTYPLDLKKLLYALQDSTLNLNIGTDALYNLALRLRSADPERAVFLLELIVDREPDYFGGQAQRDLAALEGQLYTTRVARLRAKAEEAHQQGEYGIEAASLSALLALGDRDIATTAWAKEYLKVAEQNRKMLGPYDVVQQRLADGDIATARTLLQNLWLPDNAPFFRDPAGIAPALGLKVPITYEQDKEQRRAEDAKARREREAATERDILIAERQATAKAATGEENAKWQSACNVARSDPKQATSQQVAQLRGWNVVSDAAVDSFVSQGQKMASTEGQAVHAESRADRADRAAEFIGELVFNELTLKGAAAGALFLFIYIFLTFDNHKGAVLLVCGIVLCLAILSVVIPQLFAAFQRWKAQQFKRSLIHQGGETAEWSQKWMTFASPEHARRLARIDEKRQQAVSVAQTQYQQRKAEIAAEHERTLAEIAARYPN